MKKMAIVSSTLIAIALTLGIDMIARAAPPSQLQSGEVFAVGLCTFRISNMFGGKLIVPNPDGSSPQQGIYDLPDSRPNAASSVLGSFALFCVDASEEKISTMLNAKRVNDKWLVYNRWPSSDERELTPFERGAHPQTVEFKGVNWSGTGLTVNATTGDERRRSRTFYFCLTHQAYALCGKAPVQWLADLKRRNELWKIKAILQSVEFVDVPLVVVPTAIGPATALRQ